MSGFRGGGGGTTPHDVLSTLHVDSDPTDVPVAADVLTWTGSEWEAQPGGAPGPHAIDGASHTATLDIGDGQFPAPAGGYPVDADFAAEADGIATTPARSDHRHHVTEPAAGYPVDADFAAEADGTATNPARADHRHHVTTPAAGYPLDVAAAEADGTANEPARADHVHAHGSGYLANAHHTQAHDLDGADHTLAGEVAGEFLRATGATTFAIEVVPFSVGGVVLDPTGARFVMLWRAPFAATVTNVRGHRKGGTGATVNARRNQTSDFLASDLSLTTADSWTDGGAVQNTAIVAGDDIEIEIASITGAVTEIAIQVDLTRP